MYIAAVNNTTGRIDYFAPYEDGDAVPYGYADGLSGSQVMRQYDDLPDPSTQKDDGSGNLINWTQTEIDDAAEAAQLASLDFIATLDESDPLRLTHQALFCLAKNAGEGGLDSSSSFLQYLHWVAAGA